MNSLRRLPWVALCAGFALAAGCRTESRPKAFTTVRRGDLVQRVTLTGTVVPNRKTVISAPYNGYVKKLFVSVGEAVKADQPIISITQSVRERGEEVYPLRSPFPGTVVQILASEGDYVKQAT